MSYLRKSPFRVRPEIALHFLIHLLLKMPSLKLYVAHKCNWRQHWLNLNISRKNKNYPLSLSKKKNKAQHGHSPGIIFI